MELVGNELTSTLNLSESRLTIVIPALNEAESIRQVLKEISDKLAEWSPLVVVVDGYSTDGTDTIAREMGAQVIYQRKKGYGDALMTGFNYVKENVRTKIVVMMDADLTYDPADIPNLAEPILSKQADLVVGNRFAGMQKGAMTSLNKLGNRLLSWFAKIALRLNVNDTQCGIRAFTPELLDVLHFSALGMPLATEMLSEASSNGARIREVPVNYRARSGTTKLNPLQDGLRILITILRLMRDTRPLLFFGIISAFMGVLGLLFGLEVTLEWFQTGTVRRLPTAMLSVLFIIGATQFSALALLADMMKRVYSKNKG
jgi:dolichol-phosphate mannosyltransferase